MAEITLTTWNINSVRLRLPLLRRLIAAQAPDILCLQETKVADASFPHDALAELGFSHRLIRGEKSYNGVAILSRLPLTPLGHRDWCTRGDCRHLAVGLQGGIELHNFYVPAGGDEPEPRANPKFAHKLDFLAEMEAWSGHRQAAGKRLVLVGDLNIAPLEEDVWSHKQLLGVVSHTPLETETLGRIMRAGEWIDAVRHFIPPPEKLYSWWSYRARDWRAANRGRRLDHVWVTPALKKALKGASVLSEARGWPQPSDHVPVSVRLAL